MMKAGSNYSSISWTAARAARLGAAIFAGPSELPLQLVELTLTISRLAPLLVTDQLSELLYIVYVDAKNDRGKGILLETVTLDLYVSGILAVGRALTPVLYSKKLSQLLSKSMGE